MKSISALVSLYAIALLIAGGVLLFVPETVFPSAESDGAQPLVLVQLVGAALLAVIGIVLLRRG